MCRIVIRERDADHEDDRQHREDEDAQNRDCQKGLVETVVEQRSENLLVGRKFSSFLQCGLLDHILLHIHSPDENKCRNDDD